MNRKEAEGEEMRMRGWKGETEGKGRRCMGGKKNERLETGENRRKEEMTDRDREIRNGTMREDAHKK